MTITSILKPLPIQDINDKNFFIPHYQRGYRWTEMQVQQLLNDIDQFIPIILNVISWKYFTINTEVSIDGSTSFGRFG